MIMHGGYANQMPPRPGMGGPVTAEEAEAMHEMARQHIAHANTLSQVARMTPVMAPGFTPPLQQQFSPQQMFAQQMAVQQMVAQQMAAAHMRPQLAAQMVPPMAPPMQGSQQQLAAHLARLAVARQGPVGLPPTAPPNFPPAIEAQVSDGPEYRPDIDAAQQVREQVEYYFSDHNLASDTFMRDHIAANNGGWVDVVLINSFSRMMRLGRSVQDVRPCPHPEKHLQPLPENSPFSLLSTGTPTAPLLFQVAHALAPSRVLELDPSCRCVRIRGALPGALALARRSPHTPEPAPPFAAAPAPASAPPTAAPFAAAPFAAAPFGATPFGAAPFTAAAAAAPPPPPMVIMPPPQQTMGMGEHQLQHQQQQHQQQQQQHHQHQQHQQQHQQHQQQPADAISYLEQQRQQLGQLEQQRQLLRSSGHMGHGPHGNNNNNGAGGMGGDPGGIHGNGLHRNGVHASGAQGVGTNTHVGPPRGPRGGRGPGGNVNAQGGAGNQRAPSQRPQRPSEEQRALFGLNLDKARHPYPYPLPPTPTPTPYPRP